MTTLQICSHSHLEPNQASQAFICEMDVFQYGCFQNKHLCFAAGAMSHSTSSCPRQSCPGSSRHDTLLPTEIWMTPQHAALTKDFLASINLQTVTHLHFTKEVLASCYPELRHDLQARYSTNNNNNSMSDYYIAENGKDSKSV